MARTYSSPTHHLLEILQKSASSLHKSIRVFWLLTESDFWTFVVPDTAFGILSALAGPVLTDGLPPSIQTVLHRFPYILAWNWLNLTIFDLANQRSPASSTEDAINKPWRPIPAGFMSSTQMRRALLIALPSVLALSYVVGAWQQTAFLYALTWMYNDLEAGDEHFVVRNLVIGVAFGCYNLGSLKVAYGPGVKVTPIGYRWITLISMVIFCTMQIQDLKDVAGDRTRKRRTAPIVLGGTLGRWTVIIPVILWSVICPLYMGVGFVIQSLTILLGSFIAFRVFMFRTPKADRVSWQIWAGWLLCLYSLPLVKHTTTKI